MMDEMGAWLDRLPKPLGVLAADDQRARHVVEAARRIGARIPQNIAIVGVDDDPVLGAPTEPVGYADALVDRALDVIETQLSMRVTVADVAETCGVSRRTLDGRFEDAVGRTVHAEIVRRQVERVDRLLMTTDLPLERIAQLAGFGHVNYMSRVFRRVRSMPPGAFRDRALASAATATPGLAIAVPGTA